MDQGSARFAEIRLKYFEFHILWTLSSIDLHTLTLQLPIQTQHSVVPELQVFVSSLAISAKRAHPRDQVTILPSPPPPGTWSQHPSPPRTWSQHLPLPLGIMCRRAVHILLECILVEILSRNMRGTYRLETGSRSDEGNLMKIKILIQVKTFLYFRINITMSFKNVVFSQYQSAVAFYIYFITASEKHSKQGRKKIILFKKTTIVIFYLQ